MKIKKAEYIGSYVSTDKCPDTTLPEYAFIGRSNVGKSSLINYLMADKDLAKVSGTPGKTQTINFFNINNEWHLVDLPGFGYAKTSRSKRADWDRFIRHYLANRKQLVCIFVLVDCRIPPQEKDLKYINWIGENGLPMCIVYTKMDHPNSPEIKKNIAAFELKMFQTWEELPPIFGVSSAKGTGKEDLIAYLDDCNKRLKNA